MEKPAVGSNLSLMEKTRNNAKFSTAFDHVSELLSSLEVETDSHTLEFSNILDSSVALMSQMRNRKHTLSSDLNDVVDAFKFGQMSVQDFEAMIANEHEKSGFILRVAGVIGEHLEQVLNILKATKVPSLVMEAVTQKLGLMIESTTSISRVLSSKLEPSMMGSMIQKMEHKMEQSLAKIGIIDKQLREDSAVVRPNSASANDMLPQEKFLSLSTSKNEQVKSALSQTGFTRQPILASKEVQTDSALLHDDTTASALLKSAVLSGNNGRINHALPTPAQTDSITSSITQSSADVSSSRHNQPCNDQPNSNNYQSPKQTISSPDSHNPSTVPAATAQTISRSPTHPAPHSQDASKAIATIESPTKEKDSAVHALAASSEDAVVTNNQHGTACASALAELGTTHGSPDRDSAVVIRTLEARVKELEKELLAARHTSANHAPSRPFSPMKPQSHSEKAVIPMTTLNGHVSKSEKTERVSLSPAMPSRPQSSTVKVTPSPNEELPDSDHAPLSRALSVSQLLKPSNPLPTGSSNRQSFSPGRAIPTVTGPWEMSIDDADTALFSPTRQLPDGTKLSDMAGLYFSEASSRLHAESLSGESISPRRNRSVTSAGSSKRMLHIGRQSVVVKDILSKPQMSNKSTNTDDIVASSSSEASLLVESSSSLVPAVFPLLCTQPVSKKSAFPSPPMMAVNNNDIFSPSHSDVSHPKNPLNGIRSAFEPVPWHDERQIVTNVNIHFPINQNDRGSGDASGETLPSESRSIESIISNTGILSHRITPSPFALRQRITDDKFATGAIPKVQRTSDSIIGNSIIGSRETAAVSGSPQPRHFRDLAQMSPRGLHSTISVGSMGLPPVYQPTPRPEAFTPDIESPSPYPTRSQNYRESLRSFAEFLAQEKNPLLVLYKTFRAALSEVWESRLLVAAAEQVLGEMYDYKSIVDVANTPTHDSTANPPSRVQLTTVQSDGPELPHSSPGERKPLQNTLLLSHNIDDLFTKYQARLRFLCNLAEDCVRDSLLCEDVVKALGVLVQQRTFEQYIDSIDAFYSTFGRLNLTKFCCQVQLDEFRAVFEGIDSLAATALPRMLKISTEFKRAHELFYKCQGALVEAAARMDLLRSQCEQTQQLALRSLPRQSHDSILHFNELSNAHNNAIKVRLLEQQLRLARKQQVPAVSANADTVVGSPPVSAAPPTADNDQAVGTLSFFAMLKDPNAVTSLQTLLVHLSKLRGFARGSETADFMSIRRIIQDCMPALPVLSRFVQRYVSLRESWVGARREMFATRGLTGGAADAHFTCPLCHTDARTTDVLNTGSPAHIRSGIPKDLTLRATASPAVVRRIDKSNRDTRVSSSRDGVTSTLRSRLPIDFARRPQSPPPLMSGSSAISLQSQSKSRVLPSL